MIEYDARFSGYRAPQRDSCTKPMAYEKLNDTELISTLSNPYHNSLNLLDNSILVWSVSPIISMGVRNAGQ
jgi:hypothetical protein